MKTCFKCGLELPLSAFYRHPMMRDGHLGKCKDCTKYDATKHRGENVERIRAYDRERAKQPHRAELRTRVTREWRQRHRDRQRAQNMAARALTTGKIERLHLCEGCGKAKPLEKHHPDYSQPALVMWLCKPCHAIADKVRRLTERTAS